MQRERPGERRVVVVVTQLVRERRPLRRPVGRVTRTPRVRQRLLRQTAEPRLLRDIHHIFQAHGNPEALPSLDLVTTLLQDPDAPWAEHGTKGLSVYHLGRLLRDFDIRPANYRFDKGRQAKGYARNRFLDSWARHCPDLTEPASAHPSAQSKPPAAPAGQLPIGPPGGPTGPKPAR